LNRFVRVEMLQNLCSRHIHRSPLARPFIDRLFNKRTQRLRTGILDHLRDQVEGGGSREDLARTGMQPATGATSQPRRPVQADALPLVSLLEAVATETR